MRRDQTHLLDMLIAGRRALDHVEGLTQDQFESDVLRQDAVIRCLEQVGEASTRVSPGYRSQHPGIDWRAIVGMRNRLIHEYHDVDLRLVWRTLQHDLPRLVTALEPLVPPE